MPTAGEQLAKENQDLMKKSAVVIFRFLKNALGKIDKKDITEKIQTFLSTPDNEAKLNEVEKRQELSKISELKKDNFFEIPSLKKEEVEILSSDELKNFDKAFNDLDVNYDTYVISDNECGIIFEADSLEHIKGGLTQYLDLAKEPLDVVLDKVAKLLPEIDKGVSLSKELEL